MEQAVAEELGAKQAVVEEFKIMANLNKKSFPDLKTFVLNDGKIMHPKSYNHKNKKQYVQCESHKVSINV